MSRKNSHHSRGATTRTVLLRWFFVLFYAAFAAVLGLPLGRFADHAFAVLAGFLGESGVDVQALRWVVAAGLLIIVMQQTGARLAHLRLLFRYPPTFVAAVLGICGVFGLAWLTDPEFAALSQSMAKVFAESLSLLPVVLCIVEAFAKKDPATKAVLDRPSEITLEALVALPMEELLNWLSTESAIDAPAADLFGAAERAGQVWEALQTERADGSGLELRKTVVIQGPFGAGKTSTVKLVEDLAKNSKGERYIFAHVNCWGFSSIRAQEHILEKAISELSRTVDCLALRRLPAAYADALRKSNSWFGLLAYITGEEKEPGAQLQRFTPLLRAIGAQLVIVIEDTDRNGPDFDQRHIEALLYRFRKVERVSFILTAGSKSDIDFPKIAEHILFLSPLRPDAVLAMVNRVRDHCRTWSFIDPTLGPYSSRNRPEQLDAGSSMWALPLAAILNNPRRLKITLTKIIERWKLLYGEVDIDELIMLTALREAAPRIFSFFGSHFREFKGATTEPPKNHLNADTEEARKGRLAFLKDRWRAAVSESENDSTYLAAILGELIWSSTKITDCSFFKSSNRVQSINDYRTGSRGDIYWERLTGGSITLKSVRDQDVLTAMCKAVDGADIELFGQRFAASDEFAEVVLFFEGLMQRMNQKVVLQIASPALQALRPLPPGNTEPGALVYLTRWLDMLPYNDPDYQQWLALEMERCLPNSLLDAERIFWRFGRSKMETSMLLTVRQQFVASVQRHFEGANVDVFASCFVASFPYSLGHLIRLDEKDYPSEYLTKPSDWIWLADLLIEGMKRHPQILIPQVLMLFGGFGPGGQIPTWFKLDEDRYRELFGERWPEALQLLTQDIVVDPDAEGLFRYAAPLGTAEARRLAASLVNDGGDPAPGA